MVLDKEFTLVTMLLLKILSLHCIVIQVIFINSGTIYCINCDIIYVLITYNCTACFYVLWMYIVFCTCVLSWINSVMYVMLCLFTYYFPLCLSGIGEYRKGSSPSSHPSVSHQLVHLHTFLRDGWMDFLHIGCHGQVPWSADACKIEFDVVPNLTNYGHFFINFECLL